MSRAAFAALDTRLAAFTPAMPIAWPNRVFQPETGTPYLKVDHLPAPRVRRSIGMDGRDVYPGVYQVMVCYPAGNDAGAAELRADLVAAHFPIGAAYSGVRIAAVSTAPAIQEPGWFSIPVSITYELIP